MKKNIFVSLIIFFIFVIFYLFFGIWGIFEINKHEKFLFKSDQKLKFPSKSLEMVNFRNFPKNGQKSTFLVPCKIA